MTLKTFGSFEMIKLSANSFQSKRHWWDENARVLHFYANDAKPRIILQWQKRCNFFLLTFPMVWQNVLMPLSRCKSFQPRSVNKWWYCVRYMISIFRPDIYGFWILQRVSLHRQKDSASKQIKIEFTFIFYNILTCTKSK